jgi:hypothetical protein
MIEVNDAIKKAKQWVRNIFEEEQISNLGLEEIKHEHDGRWKITLGFSRPWDAINPYLSFGGAKLPPPRTLKVITIDDGTGEIISVENRE